MMNTYQADAIMDPSPLKLSEFLIDKKYVIPDYQRNYEWGSNELEKLWLDINQTITLNIFNGDFKKEVHPHYLGAIVVKNQKHDGRYEIIDGQQRTITIMCLLIVVAELAKKLNVSGGDSVYDWINPLLQTRNSTKDTIPTLIIGRDNEFFYKTLFECRDKKEREVYWSSTLIKSKSAAKKIQDCFLYFYEVVDVFIKNNEMYSKDKCLDLLAGIILEYLFVMRVDVKSHAIAYKLFESMNFRGLALSQADLLKNELLVRASNISNEAEVSKCWSTMLDNIEEQEKINLPEFIQYHFISNFGRIKASNLFDGIAEHLDKENINALDYAMSLRDESNNLNVLINISRKLPDDVEDALKQMRDTFDIKFIYPLLMAGATKYINEKLKFNSFILLVRNFCFRYAKVQREGLSNVERNIGELSRLIRRDNCDLDLLVSEMKKLSSDENFKSKFKKYSVSNNKMGFYCISSIEDRIAKHSGLRAYSQSPSQHLEHIMPKKPEEHWEQIDILDPRYKESMMKIGNLLVLESCINGHIKNKDISYKLSNKNEKSYKESTFKLPSMVSSFVSSNNWGYDEIERRTNQLVEHYATDIWLLESGVI